MAHPVISWDVAETAHDYWLASCITCTVIIETYVDSGGTEYQKFIWVKFHN